MNVLLQFIFKNLVLKIGLESKHVFFKTRTTLKHKGLNIRIMRYFAL